MIDSKAMYENLENHLASVADEERSLIGAIIKQPSCILHAMELIEGSDFHEPDMGKVFNYLSVMFQAGEPVDDVSFLVPNLRNAGLLSIVGGVAGIAKLLEDGMPHNVRYYATQVSKWSRLRRLRNVAASILSLTDTRNPDPDDIAEKVSNALTIASATRSSDVLTAGQLVDDELLEIEKAYKSKKLIGISTGMNSVDKETGGIFSELTILAARTSVGKTAFAMELARASFKDKRVLFCSMEMSKTQLSHRLISRETGIPVSVIRNNKLTQKDMELIRKATPEIRKMEAMYWCKPDLTVAQIHAKARTHAAKHGLDMLIIDYLGLIKSPEKDLYERTSKVSNDLATLAKSLNTF